MNTPLETLQANPLMAESFSGAELALLAKYLRVATYQAKTPIMREGDAAQTMMFLLEGSAEVRSDGVRLAILKPRSFFGESMFTPTAIRIADVIARDKCSVAIFSLEQFKALQEESAEAALKICNFFTQEREEKAADKQRVFDRIDIWGRELSAWLEAGAPLRS